MEEKAVNWLTQKELARRWHCSESSIVNYRNKGLIRFFQLPGSSKVLYRLSDVEEIEQKHTNSKGGDRLKQIKKPVVAKTKGKPVVSETSDKKWRI